MAYPVTVYRRLKPVCRAAVSPQIQWLMALMGCSADLASNAPSTPRATVDATLAENPVLIPRRTMDKRIFHLPQKIGQLVEKLLGRTRRREESSAYPGGTPRASSTLTVLIAGAHGFIGRQLAATLSAAGHYVIYGIRHVPADVDGRDYRQLDYAHPDVSWEAKLTGVDVVINAVGILRETRHQTFAAMHETGPIALFEASAKAGVKLIIQFSALGADADATSAYHLSKKAADEYLREQPIPSYILQPSLVFGLEGTSTRLFTRLASLPWLTLPDAGSAQVQPVHIDDVSALVLALLQHKPAKEAITVPVVGPEAVGLAAYLGSLRRQMRLGALRVARLPAWLTHVLAKVGDVFPGSVFTSETLSMLRRGNTADATAMSRFVGRPLIPIHAFIPPALASLVRRSALLDWLLPCLRASLALVWIVTGVISLGLYPTADSLALLQQVGLTQALAPWALYGAAGLDIALGLAVMLWPHRAWVWIAQLVLMGGYTAILSWKLPAFWLHPFGPLLKNLPMLAIIITLWQLEARNGLHRR